MNNLYENYYCSKGYSYTVCIKPVLKRWLKVVLTEEKIRLKSEFFTRNQLSGLAYMETFRRMMIETLEEKGRDLDYYELKKAFEELDKIKERYQNAIDIIFKIFFSRMD